MFSVLRHGFPDKGPEQAFLAKRCQLTLKKHEFLCLLKAILG